MTASVIVPCYNVAAWVREAVRSVLRNTFRDFELIAVDDGSTDGTGRLLDELAAADARVRVAHQANAGVSAARNRGLDLARGGLVFFLDPDDFVSDDWLASGVAEMERGGADMCVRAFTILNDVTGAARPYPLRADYHFTDNASIRAGYLPRMIGYSFAQVRAWHAGAPLFAEHELGGVWRCVYRRDFLSRAGVRFDERLTFWEDAFFNCACLLAARSLTSRPETHVYTYREHAGNVSATWKTSAAAFRNKLALLRVRQELDARAGGTLAPLYAGSCVFSLLELLSLARTSEIPFAEGRAVVAEYARDSEVRAALAAFPLSLKHPVYAAAVLALRCGLAVPLYTLLRLGRRRGRVV